MTPRTFVRVSFVALSACFLASACASSGAPGRNSPPNSSADTTALPESQPGNDEGYAQPPMASQQAPSGASEGEALADKSPSQPASTRASAPSPARKSASAGSYYGAPAVADQSVAHGRAHAEAKPASTPLLRETERPGLATQWGETRTSSVTTTTFNRESSQPWSLLRIQYDDEAGIVARTGRHSGTELLTNIAETSNGFVSVQVVDGSGNPLAGLTQGTRSFVVGRNGDRYSIRISNHSSERFEILATVDGLDVIDGRSGSYSKRGYLIDAYGTLDIDGFRRSSDAVAAFRFGSVRDSYAARTGSERNVGVIGVAVFREHEWVDQRRIEENSRRDNADPFPSRYAPPPPPPPVPMIRNRE